MNITQACHDRLAAALREGDFAIDATAGNGHDTCFLAQCVGASGRVLAIDLQPEAIEHTRRRLDMAGLTDRVACICGSHAELAEITPPKWHGMTSAVVFNLGYLPGGDHCVTTEAHATLKALDAARQLLKSDGLICVVCYPGHEEGAREAAAVEAWFEKLRDRGARVEEARVSGTRRPSPFLLTAQLNGR